MFSVLSLGARTKGRDGMEWEGMGANCNDDLAVRIGGEDLRTWHHMQCTQRCDELNESALEKC